MDKETQEQIKELQSLEQNIHNSLMQKQALQAQLIEVNNALKESSTSKKLYRILGPVMIETSKENLEKYLNEKKNIIELRIKSLEKQEDKLKEKAQTIQSEVVKKIKK